MTCRTLPEGDQSRQGAIKICKGGITPGTQKTVGYRALKFALTRERGLGSLQCKFPDGGIITALMHR